jgi:hypothetical protein
VVLELTIVGASCGPFGAPPESQKGQTYEEVNKYPAIYQTCINAHRAAPKCDLYRRVSTSATICDKN